MINELRYVVSEGKISCEEFVETINYFDKNLMVGCEMERVVPQSNGGLANELQTEVMGFGDAQNHSTLMFYKTARARNPYNVAFITQDGTFEYQNEIIFGGNVEGFEWNYQKLKKIEDKLTLLSAVPYSPKTSTHISVLTASNKALNGLIYKNIFNITRAFSGALYWLGSGDKNTIVRNGVSQYARDCLQFTPEGKDINTLRMQIGKYNQINLGKQQIIRGTEKTNGIFVEWRGIDGIRVPSVIASNMMLYKAIVYKAVEVSLKGLVMVESLSSDWQRNKDVVKKLIQNNVTVEDMGFLKLESKRLIHFLSNYLKKFDKNLITMLGKIAEEPVSLRMASNKRLPTIDREIYVKQKNLNSKEQELLSVIITSEVKAQDIKRWKHKTAQKLGCTVRYIEKMLNSITDTTKLNLVFDCEQETIRID